MRDLSVGAMKRWEFRVSSLGFRGTIPGLELRVKTGLEACLLNSTSKPETGLSPLEPFHRDPLQTSQVEFTGPKDWEGLDLHELVS